MNASSKRVRSRMMASVLAIVLLALFAAIATNAHGGAFSAAFPLNAHLTIDRGSSPETPPGFSSAANLTPLPGTYEEL